MSSLKIPSSGLVLKPRNEDSKPGIGLPEAFSLTLADSVIEDMIKCVKNGKDIALSFGRTPTLLYGSKAQHLLVSNEDPFTTEIYRTEFNQNDTSADTDEMAPPSHFITRANRRQLIPTTKRVTAKATNAAAENVDVAIEALKAGMSSEMNKKASSATNIIKGTPPAAEKKRAVKPATNTSRFLSQNKKALGSSDTTRSMPNSPALSGIGSPSLGPTSVPLSQQKAEKDKEVRSWILHYLAVEKAKEAEIWDFFSARTEHTKDDFKAALNKVADYDTGNETWSLRPKAFRELDPWAFEYASQEDRQKAIEHAIRAFDKMRLGVSEPEWQKLLVESERGQGKVLSKLTAKIAEKSSAAPRGKAQRSPGHDTNTETDEDRLLGDNLSIKKGGGEAMSRSASSGPATKNKKVSEKEAQAKRLLGKPGKAKATGKASPATRTSPAKKPAAAKKEKEDSSRIKSSQFVNESDEEDDLPDPTKKVVSNSAPQKPVPAVTVAKPAVKRARADEVSEARVTQPALKKARKDEGSSTPMLNGNASVHRTSDSSQFSQTSQNSQSSRSTAASTIKTKTSSPQKSSPLASSPPTNASDIDDEDPYHTSSSGSPYTASMNPLKRKATEINTSTIVAKKQANGVRRPPQPASTSSASPASINGNASTGRVSDEVVSMADRFKSCYKTYLKLHKRLAQSPNPSPEEMRDLNAMHVELQDLKDKIFDSVS